MATYQLHWADYFVFISILLITMTIGAIFAFTGGRQKTTKEYFTGNKRLNVVPTSFSVVVTYMSAVMVIGVPVEAYSYGGALILGAVGEAVGICLAALVVVPILYPLQLMSVNKYLEMRYDSQYPKLFATGLSVMQTTTYSAVVIIAPSTAVSSLLGVPVWSVILFSAALAIFYTSIGGIKAVVWSDTFLCVCMLSGMLLICVQGINYAGGLSSAFKISLDGGRLDMFNFSPNPTARITVWSMLFGMGFNGFGGYGTMQPILQRYSNVRSLNKARLTLILASVGNMLMYIIPISAGLSIYACYKHIGCDPIKANIIDSQNQLVPHFVMEMLNFPGVPGLFTASLAAGALSSVSSVLNSSAANLWDDMLKEKLPESLTNRGALLSKLVVMIIGVIATLLCFILMVFGGTIFQLSVSINSISSLALIGMVLHGIFCPWINAKGIIAGSLTAMLFIIWIVLGQYYTIRYAASELPTDISQCNVTMSTTNHSSVIYFNSTLVNSTPYQDVGNSSTFGNIDNEMTKLNVLTWLYSISYMWYVIVGNVIILIVGTTVSLITGRQLFSHKQGQLISPCYRKMFVNFNHQDDKSFHEGGEEAEQIYLKANISDD